MPAFVQIAVTVGVALIAGWLGVRLSRADRRLYWVTVSVCLFLVVVVAMGYWDARWVTTPTLAWVSVGHPRLIVFALCGAMLQAALLSRLGRRREKALIWAFLSLVVFRVSVLPPVMAAAAVPELSRLHTQVDSRGVCIQSTGYTCGPAAAVTLLRRLGVPAEEGDLAIAAGTNVISGTEMGDLASAVESRYRGFGVVCEYRHFSSIDELRAAGATLVVIRYSSTVDHCLAVLEVNDRQVVTGDPLLGIRPYWREDFEKIWHFNGLVFGRKSAATE